MVNILFQSDVRRETVKPFMNRQINAEVVERKGVRPGPGGGSLLNYRIALKIG